jgi:hypothetical protein
MDRPQVRELREKLEAALAPLAEELELTITVGGGTYTSNNVVFKVELAEIAEDGMAMSREAESFKVYAYRYGLKPEHLGQQFMYAGKTYKLVGAKPKSTRYPLVAEEVPSGKRIKMSPDLVKMALKV